MCRCSNRRDWHLNALHSGFFWPNLIATSGQNNILSKIILSNTSLSKIFLSNMNMAYYIMSYIMLGQTLVVQNILVLGQLGPILVCQMFRPKSFSPLTLCSHASFVQMIFVSLFLVHILFSPMLVLSQRFSSKWFSSIAFWSMYQFVQCILSIWSLSYPSWSTNN